MAKGKVSLQEIMGREASGKGGSLSLSDLPSILGDNMPEMPKNSVGRFRLIRALQQRFGKNYRSLPGVGDLIKEFDSDVEYEGTMAKLKDIKVKRSE